MFENVPGERDFLQELGKSLQILSQVSIVDYFSMAVDGTVYIFCRNIVWILFGTVSGYNGVQKTGASFATAAVGSLIFFALASAKSCKNVCVSFKSLTSGWDERNVFAVILFPLTNLPFQNLAHILHALSKTLEKSQNQFFGN